MYGSTYTSTSPTVPGHGPDPSHRLASRPAGRRAGSRSNGSQTTLMGTTPPHARSRAEVAPRRPGPGLRILTGRTTASAHPPRPEAPTVPDPDPSSDDSLDNDALRADIRRLGTLLGRDPGPPGGAGAARPGRGGPRAGPRRPRRGRQRCWPRVDVGTATQLVRAFATYFHLANVTEQVHRGRELRRQRREQRRLAGPGRRRDRRPPGVEPRTRSPRRSPGWRSGRSSPPTRPRRPAARSCPSCARVADLLDEASPALTRTPTAGCAELVDLLWQTDELRVDRPDAARRGPQRRLLPRRAVPRARCRDVLDDLADDAAPASAWSCRRRPGRWRSAPGSAATATATRTSPPRSPATCCELQHEHAIRAASTPSTSCGRSCRRRPGCVGGLRRSCPRRLAADLAALPELDAAVPAAQRRGAVPAQGAPASRRSSLNTRARLAGAGTARARPRLPRHGDELLADLVLLRDSLLAAPRRARRARPARPGHPDRRRVRPAPGHDGRPRARRRAPRARSAPWSTGSASRAGGTLDLPRDRPAGPAAARAGRPPAAGRDARHR